MIRLRSGAIALFLFCLLLFPDFSPAQSGEDGGTLYFPPKLTVNYQFDDRNPVLGITETTSRSTTFLIPVIFFDDPGSWVIPPRYKLFSGSFSARDYADTNPINQWDPMEKYHEILNIVGFRMREHPRTTIRIRGGYSGEPGENAGVGAARAEVVRDYLVNIWDIPSERIEIAPPQQMCDSGEHLFRQHEARNVTIVQGDWEILKPVDYTIAVRNVGSLYLRFTIDPYVTPEDVAEIELVMTADDNVIGQAVVPGSPDSTIYRLRGTWWRRSAQIKKGEEISSIAVDAYVRLRDGRVRRSNTRTIAVRSTQYVMEEPDITLRALTIPFFGYGDSTLTGYHRTLIDQFMARQPAGQQLALDFTGNADFSEDPEVDPTVIADYMSEMSYEQEPTSIEEPAFDNGQLALWLPPRLEDLNYDYERISIEDVEFSDEISEEEIDTVEPEIEEHRFTSDSLAMARTRMVERYLRDSLKINFATFDQLPGRMRGVGTTVEILPEQRWLARSVRLAIYPYNQFAKQQERLQKEMGKSTRE